MWPNRQLLDLLGIELPIIQAPMAGASGPAMAVAVSAAGGLGSLPCAMLDPIQAQAEITLFRQSTSKPLNLNFLCHVPPEPDPAMDLIWKKLLTPYYAELGLDAAATAPAAHRAPFNAEMCEVVEEYKPEVVSFHFGLPDQSLLLRVINSGSLVISSATTVEEAIWLEDNGCDAIIAQGVEAGGHRGMFLTDNIVTQPGIFALIPQVVDAVSVPIIAAGGIADGRGIAAAFALGAAAVQIGTAYLLTPESLITELHREALHTAQDDRTALTNLFSGRPARGIMNRVMREIGPISEQAPAFPTAGAALAPLKSKSEADDNSDFSALWSGQAVALASEMTASELTRKLVENTLSVFESLTIVR